MLHLLETWEEIEPSNRNWGKKWCKVGKEHGDWDAKPRQAQWTEWPLLLCTLWQEMTKYKGGLEKNPRHFMTSKGISKHGSERCLPCRALFQCKVNISS